MSVATGSATKLTNWLRKNEPTTADTVRLWVDYEGNRSIVCTWLADSALQNNNFGADVLADAQRDCNTRSQKRNESVQYELEIINLATSAIATATTTFRRVAKTEYEIGSDRELGFQEQLEMISPADKNVNAPDGKSDLSSMAGVAFLQVMRQNDAMHNLLLQSQQIIIKPMQEIIQLQHRQYMELREDNKQLFESLIEQREVQLKASEQDNVIKNRLITILENVAPGAIQHLLASTIAGGK